MFSPHGQTLPQASPRKCSLDVLPMGSSLDSHPWWNAFGCLVREVSFKSFPWRKFLKFPSLVDLSYCLLEEFLTSSKGCLPMGSLQEFHTWWNSTWFLRGVFLRREVHWIYPLWNFPRCLAMEMFLKCFVKFVEFSSTTELPWMPLEGNVLLNSCSMKMCSF